MCGQGTCRELLSACPPNRAQVIFNAERGLLVEVISWKHFDWKQQSNTPRFDKSVSTFDSMGIAFKFFFHFHRENPDDECQDQIPGTRRSHF